MSLAVAPVGVQLPGLPVVLPHEQQKIADAVRLHVTKNSAIALRYVKAVDAKWILKTSSGKTARSANKEKFMLELQKELNGG